MARVYLMYFKFLQYLDKIEFKKNSILIILVLVQDKLIREHNQ